MREALASYDMAVLEPAISQRVAFAESAAQGRSVLEMDATSVASQEVNALLAALLAFAGEV